MIRIEHIAYWVDDIEQLCAFHARYFGARIGPRYENPAKGFSSRFVDFGGGARIEFMQTNQPLLRTKAGEQAFGLTHLALSLGSTEAVDQLTSRLRDDGYAVLDGPRWTGDGYYESVILDPEGNRLELTA